MQVPPWFRERITDLKQVGFLGNVELSDEDLAFQWDRHGGDRDPAIIASMIARHRTRACKVPQDVALPQTRTLPYFERLQDITNGRLVLADVKDRWEGTELTCIELSTSRGRWELAIPVCRDEGKTFGPLDPMSLLGALNALADAGRFALIQGHAVFVDADELRALHAAEVALVEIEPRPDLVRLLDSGIRPKLLIRRRSVSELAKDAGLAGAGDHSHTVRKAYRPQLDDTVPEQLCKFGGRPWLPAGTTSLPHCPTCTAPTALLFQSPLRELPIAVKREGTLQVFVCRGADASACFIHHSGVVVREVDGPLALLLHDGPALQLRAITGWEPFDDLPGPSDHERAKLDPDRATEDDIDAADGFKCGGWPKWQQDAEWACERCGKPCKLAMQIPEHDGLAFGDCGFLFILVCDTARCRKWVGAVLQYA